ncbi:MAG: endolytic transglycosylase MltG [Clostridiaceae bacterium]|jgi:cell division protein YceG involved in septum cleavage|nr:endolytic transglycosylase MltG [Clostridiaceae bacterium]
MSKLHGKSVLLGMGIGIILTAVLGIIFFLGYAPEMDEAKVKDLARKYGMIEPHEHPGKLEITISEDDTITGIVKKLEQLGIVKNAVSFQIKIVNRNAKDKILPGTYEFVGNESEDEVIDILTGSTIHNE